VVYGVNIVMGFAGQASLGHAALLAIGAYASALLAKNFGVPIIFSGLIAVVLTAIVALFLAFPSFKISGLYLAVLTIAFNIIVHQIIINADTITNGPVGIPEIPPLLPPWFGHEATLVIILVLLYLAYRLNKNILRSFFVRELWAIHQDEYLAMAFGINVYWIKIIAFELSALLIGIGGVLYAHIILYISPEMSAFFQSVLFVMMLIAGGSGTLPGPIIGTIILTLLPEGMAGLNYYKQSIFGLLLVLIALFFPKGIFGLIHRFLPARDSNPQSIAFDKKLRSALSASHLPSAEHKDFFRVESLSKNFGGVTALAWIDLEVKPRTIHSIIGPNGSGKTTLLNIISGFHRSDSGDIIFSGKSIARLSSHRIARRGITRTFQNLNLLEDHTVMENVLLGLHTWWRGSVFGACLGSKDSQRSEREKEAFCYEILEMLGIESLFSKTVSELPYGQKKIVEVCRALVAKPRVILMDEPTSGLSPVEINKFIPVLRRVVEMGITTILIEHHLDVVKSISDHVTVLDQGIVIARGTYEEVVRNPKVAEAYLGENTDAEKI
jgi:branched-chain amino acid transport system permease protein